MERFSESEKLISTTLDNLPQPFMIFGKKKEHNPVEEFWMNKLECIEKQYNEHIVKLERSLLANSVKKRTLVQKNETIHKLKGVLNEKKDQLDTLGDETKKLEHTLTMEKYNANSMKNKVTKLEYVKSKVMRNLAVERFERMHHEREISKLKRRLENLERDKRFLLQEVATKNEEQSKMTDRQVQLVQNKQNLIRSLTELDQERRNQANTNVTLNETVGVLMDIGKSHEMQLLQQRKEIDAIAEEMRVKRKEHAQILRQLSSKDRKVTEARDSVKYSKEKVDHLERQARHWKEQIQAKESQVANSKLGIQDLHRENSGLRCQLAELREKLNRTSGELKCLEMQKHRTELELQKAEGQARSLQILTHRNELMKQRLAEKILKTHPSVQTALMEKRAEAESRGRRGPPRTQRREVDGYKKRIWELECAKKDLDRRILESKGRQNRLTSKLEKYSGMGQQVLWTEKAMVKLEGDRNRLEDLLKTMALNVPNKLPFQRLVTDPSILDRVAKYQVLQKRLLKQSTRVEELKRTAMEIMEFRRRKSEEELADRRGELPPWKMSHWKRHSSQDTLADVDNQTLDPEGGGAPLPERKYYKEYMSYLDSEIPSVKKQLALMERRQQQKQQRLADAEAEAQRKKFDQEQRDGSFDSVSTVPPVPIPTEIILEPLQEDDEEEDDDEGVNEDSDMDGLLGVISIDETPSARAPSTTPSQFHGPEDNEEDNGADADESESESDSEVKDDEKAVIAGSSQ